ncbi:MAG: hypothetical protein ACI9RP_000464 [Cyclobacteriaceae bacterium]|jgi:uncharacterized protein (DUF302 family)
MFIFAFSIVFNMLFVTKLVLFLLFICFSFFVSSQNMTVYRSKTSVEETTNNLISLIKQKELKLFEVVYHQDIAIERGTEIDTTNVILFEDVMLSSALILCEQTSALDLPLKIIVWEEHEDVYIGYFDPLLMRRKYLIDGCDETLKKMSGVISRLINESLRMN